MKIKVFLFLMLIVVTFASANTNPISETYVEVITNRLELTITDDMAFRFPSLTVGDMVSVNAARKIPLELLLRDSNTSIIQLGGVTTIHRYSDEFNSIDIHINDQGVVKIEKWK